jgi:hypothetical protein
MGHEGNLNGTWIPSRPPETRVWTMEWECFISGGWDCWGVNMLLSWGFGLPMPLWVTTHPRINSFCWCLAWLLGSSRSQIPKPIQHDSPKLVHVMSSAAENRRISPMYSANINFLGAVDYYWTTKLYQIDVWSPQSGKWCVWTKYVNPEIQLKSTHGRWSRWWSGQCSQCRSRSPNYFRPCTMPYHAIPCHFFHFWISLVLQLDYFCQSGRLSADCRHCCSLKQLQEHPLSGVDRGAR